MYFSSQKLKLIAYQYAINSQILTNKSRLNPIYGFNAYLNSNILLNAGVEFCVDLHLTLSTFSVLSFIDYINYTCFQGFQIKNKIYCQHFACYRSLHCFFDEIYNIFQICIDNVLGEIRPFDIRLFKSKKSENFKIFKEKPRQKQI